MPSRRGEQGHWGETQACSFLQRNGFEVVERNFHTTAGEIDIVALKGDDVYFVEVKTRLAGPMAYDLAVTPQKVRKLRKTMAAYCVRRNIVDRGLVLASLMVIVQKQAKKITFRLAVLL